MSLLSINDPLISVVIPARNAAEFLGSTLLSIKNQERSDVEIIIADGASTDNTRIVVDSFSSMNIVFLSQPDRGQLEALQRGLSVARGKIVHWLNADDIMMPDTLNYVVDVFERYPEVDLVFSDDFAFDEVSKQLFVGPTIRGLRYYDHILFYRQMYSECVFWRSSITRYLPEKSYDLRVYTDYAFISHIESGGTTRWVPKRLGAFRIRQGQVSQLEHSRKELEYVRVREALYQSNGWSLRRVYILRCLHAPSFFVRQGLWPALERATRRIWRLITMDARRHSMQRAFFDGWLGNHLPDVRAIMRLLYR